ncbi:MAG: hypothetical protein MK108_03540 [Mariniblastus sp.]|nr:hypothetical protein [Mariniblastus sp.]
MDAYYWSIVLVVIGMFVLLLELFVPSAGMLGIAAIVLLLVGIIVGFTSSFGLGVTLMACTLLAVLLLFAVMVKVWPHTPIGRRILITPVDSPDDVLPHSEYLDEIHQSIGKLGRAQTKMLPSGIVLIDGKKFDALSDGLPIEQGQAIKVVAIKGNRILVQPYHGDVDQDLPAADSDMLSQPIEDLGIDGLDDPLG